VVEKVSGFLGWALKTGARLPEVSIKIMPAGHRGVLRHFLTLPCYQLFFYSRRPVSMIPELAGLSSTKRTLSPPLKGWQGFRVNV
jgi:hypothetical protein